jgi:hypothetical protein
LAVVSTVGFVVGTVVGFVVVEGDDVGELPGRYLSLGLDVVCVVTAVCEVDNDGAEEITGNHGETVLCGEDVTTVSLGIAVMLSVGVTVGAAMAGALVTGIAVGFAVETTVGSGSRVASGIIVS